MTRTLERTAMAVAALLLQLIFILLFAHFLLTPQGQTERAREMLLLLRPLVRTAPARPAPGLPPPRALAVPQPAVVPPPLLNAPPSVINPAAPSALEAIGRALYGCTPEKMANLSPQDRAKCPPLAQAPIPDQDLLAPPRSHAKDEALWLEEKAERDWRPECAGAEQVAKCMMHQSMAEQQRREQARAAIAEERRRRNQPPPAPVPKGIGQTP